MKECRKELTKMERRLTQKEENLDNKIESLERKENNLNEKHREADEVKKKIDETLSAQMHMLERISGVTADEAKTELLARVESEISHETALRIAEYEAR